VATRPIATRGQVVLNFDEADIGSVIRVIAEMVGINYILDPGVRGAVTIQTAGKIPVEELLPTLEQILAVNNFTMVQVGDIYRVVPVEKVRGLPIAARMGRQARTVPLADRIIIQIVPVRFVPSATMQEVVKPLVSAKATMIPVKGTNSFILVDTASNIKKVLRVVELLDTDTFDRFHTKLYPLEHADVETLTAELQQMFTALGYGDAPGAPLAFIPIPRLNALLVVNGLPELTPAIEMWTARLDQPVQRGEEQTFVYYVQYGDAENIASILGSLFQPSEAEDQAPSPAPAPAPEPGREKVISPTSPEFQKEPPPAPGPTSSPQVAAAGGTGPVSLFVVPDTETNALVLRTKPVHYQSVLAVIKKLDRKPKQVIIEVLIAEVTLEGDFALGLEYAFRGVDFKQGRPRITSAAQLASPVAESGGLPLANLPSAITSTGGLSVLVTNPNRFLAVLDAFAKDNNLNIISSPSILTAENKEAEISVVTEVPIRRTTTDPNTNQTRTDFEFRDVGVTLKVTPKITDDRYVTLEIEQELSEIGTRTEGDDAPPNFNSREAKTTVAVKDNQTIIIGGLISERTSETVTGIPFLNRIPILKHIFGSTVIEKKKTELLVMLTPRVIVEEDDARAISDLYNERLQTLQKFLKESKMRSP
jgi:general secretion pathway protein D